MEQANQSTPAGDNNKETEWPRLHDEEAPDTGLPWSIVTKKKKKSLDMAEFPRLNEPSVKNIATGTSKPSEKNVEQMEVEVASVEIVSEEEPEAEEEVEDQFVLALQNMKGPSVDINKVSEVVFVEEESIGCWAEATARMLDEQEKSLKRVSGEPCGANQSMAKRPKKDVVIDGLEVNAEFVIDEKVLGEEKVVRESVSQVTVPKKWERIPIFGSERMGKIQFEPNNWAMSDQSLIMPKKLRYIISETKHGWGTATILNPSAEKMEPRMIPSPVAFLMHGHEQSWQIGDIFSTGQFRREMNRFSTHGAWSAAKAPELLNGSVIFSHVAENLKFESRTGKVDQELALPVKVRAQKRGRWQCTMVGSHSPNQYVLPTSFVDPCINVFGANEFFLQETLELQNWQIPLFDAERRIVGMIPKWHTKFWAEELKLNFQDAAKQEISGKIYPIRLFGAADLQDRILRANLIGLKDKKEQNEIKWISQMTRLPPLALAAASRGETVKDEKFRIELISMSDDGRLNCEVDWAILGKFKEFLKTGLNVSIWKDNNTSLGTFSVVFGETNKVTLRRHRYFLTKENKDEISSMPITDDRHWLWEAQDIGVLRDCIGNQNLSAKAESALEDSGESSLGAIYKSIKHPMRQNVAPGKFIKEANEQAIKISSAQEFQKSECELPEVLKEVKRLIEESVQLNAKQRVGLIASLYENAMVLQLAPAGSGKTHAFAIFIKILMQQNLIRTILVTAVTNEATNNLYNSFMKVGVNMEHVLHARSGMSQNSLWQGRGENLEVPEFSGIKRLVRMQEEMVEENPNLVDEGVEVEARPNINNLASVARAVENFKIHPGVHYSSEEVNVLAFKHMGEDEENPRVLLATTSMARKIVRKIDAPFDLVLIDEGGQVENTTYYSLNLNARFPIKRVMVTGDLKQLQTYIPAGNNYLKLFGLESLLSLFDRNQNTVVVNLSEIYRFHPQLFRVINKVLYDGELETNVKPEERSAMDNYPGRLKSCPVVLADVIGVAVQEAEGFSYVNEEQKEEVKRQVVSLIRNVEGIGNGELTATVISLYKAMATELTVELAVFQRDFPRATKFESHTVDSFQARESDIIILATVKEEKESAESFAANQERLTVALTRARHGMIIVGDMNKIAETENLLARFIQEAKAEI